MSVMSLVYVICVFFLYLQASNIGGTCSFVPVLYFAHIAIIHKWGLIDGHVQ